MPAIAPLPESIYICEDPLVTCNYVQKSIRLVRVGLFASFMQQYHAPHFGDM